MIHVFLAIFDLFPLTVREHTLCCLNPLKLYWNLLFGPNTGLFQPAFQRDSFWKGCVLLLLGGTFYQSQLDESNYHILHISSSFVFSPFLSVCSSVTFLYSFMQTFFYLIWTIFKMWFFNLLNFGYILFSMRRDYWELLNNTELLRITVHSFNFPEWS